MAEFADWDSFYIIVGPSAGALIGLQFVVLTLIAERPPKSAAAAGAAFATPTVVYFGMVLLLAAVLRAPWHAIAPPAVLWGAIGLSGFVYVLVVARRMRSQQTYKPGLEDWLFHFVVPLLACAAISISAIAATTHTKEALFGVGGAALLLLFCAIHNAWDAVSYHVFSSTGDAAD